VNALTARKRNFKSPKYFYEVEFNKPGGMIMPILVEITYEDVQWITLNIHCKFGEKVMIVLKGICY
jgi:hypothetical protein